MKWVFDIFVASKQKCEHHTDDSDGFCDECIEFYPDDELEGALIQELETAHAAACVAEPELAARDDKHAEKILLSRAAGTVQRSILRANVCSTDHLEKLGAMIRNPDAHGYFHLGLSQNLFGLCLGAMHDDKAFPIGRQQIETADRNGSRLKPSWRPTLRSCKS